MEIILIILTSTILGAVFNICIEYGKRVGEMKAKESYDKEQVIEITNKNKKAFRQVEDFAKFNG